MEEWPEISTNWSAEEIQQDGRSISNDKIIKDKALKRIVKNDKIHYIKAKALTDLCKKPKKGEQYRIVTEKQFNAYALILSLLQEEKQIDELLIAIYRINEPTVNSIIDFIESRKIKKASFVISNFFNQTKKPEKWAIKLKEFADKNKNVNHCYTHNHAKVILIKIKNDFFVFEGSGNMSDNARIEQYIYENNKDVFDFHKNWIEKLTK